MAMKELKAIDESGEFTLYEELLSDGSKAYCVGIDHETPNDLMLACASRDDAQNVFSVLGHAVVGTF